LFHQQRHVARQRQRPSGAPIAALAPASASSLRAAVAQPTRPPSASGSRSAPVRRRPASSTQTTAFVSSYRHIRRRLDATLRSACTVALCQLCPVARMLTLAAERGLAIQTLDIMLGVPLAREGESEITRCCRTRPPEIHSS
jgi:hypothetical protein